MMKVTILACFALADSLAEPLLESPEYDATQEGSEEAVPDSMSRMRRGNRGHDKGIAAAPGTPYNATTAFTADTANITYAARHGTTTSSLKFRKRRGNAFSFLEETDAPENDVAEERDTFQRFGSTSPTFEASFLDLRTALSLQSGNDYRHNSPAQSDMAENRADICTKIAGYDATRAPYALYVILQTGQNIPQTASEVRRAYMAMAKRCHPDKNLDRDTKDAFQKIVAAFEKLKTDERVALYNNEEFQKQAERNERKAARIGGDSSNQPSGPPEPSQGASASSSGASGLLRRLGGALYKYLLSGDSQQSKPQSKPQSQPQPKPQSQLQPKPQPQQQPQRRPLKQEAAEPPTPAQEQRITIQDQRSYLGWYSNDLSIDGDDPFQEAVKTVAQTYNLLLPASRVVGKTHGAWANEIPYAERLPFETWVDKDLERLKAAALEAPFRSRSWIPYQEVRTQYSDEQQRRSGMPVHRYWGIELHRLDGSMEWKIRGDEGALKNLFGRVFPGESSRYSPMGMVGTAHDFVRPKFPVDESYFPFEDLNDHEQNVEAGIHELGRLCQKKQQHQQSKICYLAVLYTWAIFPFHFPDNPMQETRYLRLVPMLSLLLPDSHDLRVDTTLRPPVPDLVRYIPPRDQELQKNKRQKK
ncbi:unnamed protein product [Amoebophrya sp. A25]|nr:unnamed protein product [Amoebophrya sp. A25]|eukprot:GSA25T00012711001.1